MSTRIYFCEVMWLNYLLIAVVSIIIWCLVYREPFTTRRDKAKSIAEWWNQGGGDYTDYRKSTSGGSNIVEYYDIKRGLGDTPYVTTDDVMKVV